LTNSAPLPAHTILNMHTPSSHPPNDSYAYPITVTGHTTAPDGSVASLTAEADLSYAASGRKPPKGVLNWVGQPAAGKEPESAEVWVPAGCVWRLRSVGDCTCLLVG
jgi:hypothetical protein